MKLKPLHDRVVVKPAEAEEKTASGIVLPDSAKEKPTRGKVIAAGGGQGEQGDRQGRGAGRQSGRRGLLRQVVGH